MAEPASSVDHPRIGVMPCLDGTASGGIGVHMNVQRIRDLITGGFEPFVIKTSDGQVYDVPHPEFVAIGQGVVVVIGKNDRVNTLDPLHITAVEKGFSSGNKR